MEGLIGFAISAGKIWLALEIIGMVFTIIVFIIALLAIIQVFWRK